MRDTIIRVENIGKKYKIGGAKASYKTLRESLVQTVSAPLKRVKRMLSGEQYGAADVDEDIWALKDISFEVKRGDVLGVIGRNGVGKSTLLKILSRITEPTEGHARIHGRVGSLLEVGTGFHPELTGRENVFLNGSILGMRKVEIERKLDEIVSFSEIEKFIDTPVKFYSSGMYVRLAFAVAAHLEPDILLVDEVLAVGDIAFQKKCLGKMNDVAKGGRTVLFVSHNMAAILNLCSKAILLNKGTLVCKGSQNEVVDHYLDSNVTSSSDICFPEDRLSLSNDFRFCAVRIIDMKGQSTSKVLLSEGFNLEIEYEILSPIKGPEIGFVLWNSRGESVFTSTEIDEKPSDLDSVRLPGHYTSRCFVSPEYLRHGIYQIDIFASQPKIRWLDKASSVVFVEIIDDGSTESLISQGRKGIIAPCLHWDISRLKGPE